MNTPDTLTVNIPDRPLTVAGHRSVVTTDSLTLTFPPGSVLLLSDGPAHELLDAGVVVDSQLSIPAHTVQVRGPEVRSAFNEARAEAINVTVPPDAIHVHLESAPPRVVTVERDARGQIKTALIEDE